MASLRRIGVACLAACAFALAAPVSGSEPVDSPPAATQSPERTLEESARQSAELQRLAEELQRQRQLYARRPLRKYLSVSPREPEYAQYLRAWTARVERVGNLQFPRTMLVDAKRNSIIVSVVIRRDGTVEDMVIQGANVDEKISAAVFDIIRLAEPFAPIPQTGEDIDQLIITRTWVFEPGKGIATVEPLPAVQTDLRRRYADALLDVVRQEWNTRTAPPTVKCHVSFTQIPSGEVISVAFGECPFDEAARKGVEAALITKPMPYAGFESVFQRKVTLTLCHPVEDCGKYPH